MDGQNQKNTKNVPPFFVTALTPAARPLPKSPQLESAPVAIFPGLKNIPLNSETPEVPVSKCFFPRFSASGKKWIF